MYECRVRQAGIAPAILLHFRHPWRSDAGSDITDPRVTAAILAHLETRAARAPRTRLAAPRSVSLGAAKVSANAPVSRQPPSTFSAHPHPRRACDDFAAPGYRPDTGQTWRIGRLFLLSAQDLDRANWRSGSVLGRLEWTGVLRSRACNPTTWVRNVTGGGRTRPWTSTIFGHEPL